MCIVAIHNRLMSLCSLLSKCIVNVADSLQELKRRAVLIGFKPCQARLYACFAQKASFLFWFSDPDAVDDADRIVRSGFVQMPKESEYIWMAYLDLLLHHRVTQTVKIQIFSSQWSVIFCPLLVGQSLPGLHFVAVHFERPHFHLWPTWVWPM